MLRTIIQTTWLTVFLGLDPIPYRLAFTGTPGVECPETSPSTLGTLLGVFDLHKGVYPRMGLRFGVQSVFKNYQNHVGVCAEVPFTNILRGIRDHNMGNSSGFYSRIQINPLYTPNSSSFSMSLFPFDPLLSLNSSPYASPITRSRVPQH